MSDLSRAIQRYEHAIRIQSLRFDPTICLRRRMPQRQPYYDVCGFGRRRAPYIPIHKSTGFTAHLINRSGECHELGNIQNLR